MSSKDIGIGHARILVVEDDNTIALGLVSALEHERFEVQHVDSAEAAYDSIARKPPDLLLCDIMLPGADGLELLRRVKSSHERPDPVVK